MGRKGGAAASSAQASSSRLVRGEPQRARLRLKADHGAGGPGGAAIVAAGAAAIGWRFPAVDARITGTHLYPAIEG